MRIPTVRVPGNRTLVLRCCAAGLLTVLIASAYSTIQSAPSMADAATAFLNSLTPEQRRRATFGFQDAERINWYYTPVPRKGLPLRDMTSTQREAALALLRVGLSQAGYTKATQVMSLEDLLLEIEGRGSGRDSSGYFFSIFGQPSTPGVWGYRVEGHHLSQNFTVVADKVQGAPSFFGTNPAEVRQGPRRGLRVLGREEDLARDFVQLLTPEQRKSAVISSRAPGDILTSNDREAALRGEPAGIAVSSLNPQQRQKLQSLLDEYCNNMAEDLAEQRHEQIRKAGSNLWFAWAGGTERGDPHYYRVQTPEFLIELDNTQNGGNHIHSVWRDFADDFGRDLLKEHYQTSHQR